MLAMRGRTLHVPEYLSSRSNLLDVDPKLPLICECWLQTNHSFFLNNRKKCEAQPCVSVTILHLLGCIFAYRTDIPYTSVGCYNVSTSSP